MSYNYIKMNKNGTRINAEIADLNGFKFRQVEMIFNDLCIICHVYMT